tara:strand:- start:2592 stop:3485 length:894 start_codon:yes stop_codon:yes gene_type:complete
MSQIILSHKEKKPVSSYIEISNLLNLKTEKNNLKLDDPSFYEYFMNSPVFIKSVLHYNFIYDNKNTSLLDYFKLKLKEDKLSYDNSFPFFTSTIKSVYAIKLSKEEEELVEYLNSKIKLSYYYSKNYFEIKTYHKDEIISYNLLKSVYNSLEEFLYINKKTQVDYELKHLSKNIERLKFKKDSLQNLLAIYKDTNQNNISSVIENNIINFKKELDLISNQYNLLNNRFFLIEQLNLNNKSLFYNISPIYTYPKKYYPSLSILLLKNLTYSLMISILISFIIFDFEKIKLFYNYLEKD